MATPSPQSVAQSLSQPVPVARSRSRSKERLASKNFTGSPPAGSALDTDEEALSSSPPNASALSAISEAESVDSEDEDSHSVGQYEERMRIGGGLIKEMSIKSGYLNKKGERRKNWKKRYFVLRPDKICYYKNDKEYQVLRHIPLLDIQTCAAVALKKHDDCFGLVTPKRTYYVQANSKADCSDWIAKINDAKYELQQQSTSSTNSDAPTPVANMSIADTGDITPPASHPVPIAAPRSTTMSGTPASSVPISSSYASTISSELSPGGIIPPPNSVMPGNIPLPPVEQSHFGSAVDASLAQLQGVQTTARPSFTESTEPRRPSMRAISPSLGVTSSEDEDDYDEEYANYQPSVIPQQPLTPGFVSGKQLDPSRVIVAGYLAKQGKRKTWRKRWFVLYPTKLVYSRSHMVSKHQREVPLSNILDVMEFEGATLQKARPLSTPGILSSPNPRAGPPSPAVETSYFAHPAESPGMPSSPLPGRKQQPLENCFKIITPKRDYILCAPTEDDEVKWMSSLRVLINANRPENAGQTTPKLSTPHKPLQKVVATHVIPPTPPAETTSITDLPAESGSQGSQSIPLAPHPTSSVVSTSPSDQASPHFQTTPGLIRKTSALNLNMPSIESQLAP